MTKPGRQKRVKGESPLRGQGAELPCGVWGNAPTVPRVTISPNAPNKGAGSEASLPVTLRIRRCAPNLLYLPLAHCRAKWARPTSIERNGSLAAGLFCCMGFASAEATRGLCGRPLDCFASTSKRLDFSCCRDFAPASATRGLCGRPLDPFALRQLCYWNLSRQNRPRNSKRAALPLLGTPLCFVKPAPDA